jgi:Dolichyl-phosphate-mannose-protein mannosyltransferase
VAASSHTAVGHLQPASAGASRERRTVVIALSAATVAAAALRLPFLGHQSLWLDETFTRAIVREASLAGVWRHVRATESTPPLYYVLAWLLHARSTVALRLIPALALVAAVPVGYLAVQRLIGWRSALATAAILAVSPVLVSYATDARAYGLFVLAGLLTVWAFSALVEHSSTRRFGLWAAASVACVWTHYFGIFLVGGEVLVLLVVCPHARRAVAGWSAVVLLLVLPLVPLALSQSGDERAEFIAGIPLGTRFTETVRQFAMGPNVPRTWLEAAGVAIFCAALAAGVIIACRSDQGPRALLAVAVIAFGAPLLLSALGIEDRFYVRNVIVVAPLAAALAAPALLRLRGVPLALYLALATLTSIWVATDWRYEQVNWKAALARAQAIEPHAAVVAVTQMNAPVIQTYLARTQTGPAGLSATRAWIVVEPVRAAGHRALGPSPVPSLPGFTVLKSLQVDAVRLVLVGASRPTRIAPGEIPGASVFAGDG